MGDEKKRLLTKEFRAETKMFAECILHDDSQERQTILALLDHADAADEEIERLTKMYEDVCEAHSRMLTSGYQLSAENESLRQQNDRLKRELRRFWRAMLDGDGLPDETVRLIREIGEYDDEEDEKGDA